MGFRDLPEIATLASSKRIALNPSPSRPIFRVDKAGASKNKYIWRFYQFQICVQAREAAGGHDEAKFLFLMRNWTLLTNGLCLIGNDIQSHPAQSIHTLPDFDGGDTWEIYLYINNKHWLVPWIYFGIRAGCRSRFHVLMANGSSWWLFTNIYWLISDSRLFWDYSEIIL